MANRNKQPKWREDWEAKQLVELMRKQEEEAAALPVWPSGPPAFMEIRDFRGRPIERYMPATQPKGRARKRAVRLRAR